MSWLDEVKFDGNGLIPAIAQDVHTGRILMVAWQNRQALQLSAETKQAVYFSRSRQKLWHKGEESGHIQHIHEIRLDCDADVIVLVVEQQGGIACHTGRESCFYRKLTPDGWQIVDQQIKDPATIYGQQQQTSTTHRHSMLMQNSTATSAQIDVLTHLGRLMQQRKSASGDQSYVASLYQKGINKILEKIGEEATETMIAAKDFAHISSIENRHDVIYEVADLWFHSIVMLGYFDLDPQVVLDELARRQGLSGLDEKASRE